MSNRILSDLTREENYGAKAFWRAVWCLLALALILLVAVLSSCVSPVPNAGEAPKAHAQAVNSAAGIVESAQAHGSFYGRAQ